MNILYHRLLALGRPFRCGGGGDGGSDGNSGDGGTGDAATAVSSTTTDSDAAAAITGMCSTIGNDAIALAESIANSEEANTTEANEAISALGDLADAAEACVATVASIAVNDPGSLDGIAQGIANGVASAIAGEVAALGNPSLDADNTGVVGGTNGAVVGNDGGFSNYGGGFDELVVPFQRIINQPSSSITTQRGDQSGSIDGSSATQFWGYTANQTYAARAAQGQTIDRQEATDIARTAAVTQRTDFSINTNVDISAQIRAELEAGPQTQGYLNLILEKYNAEDLARAYPEFGNAADYQAAKDGLPEGLVVPGSLDAEGRVQAVQGTPEFIQAQQIATQAARDAVRKAAIDNGLGGPDGKDVIAITGVGPDGRVFLTTTRGEIDITKYFEGLPQQPVPISIAVQSGATTDFDTGFRKVEILAPTPTNQVVNTKEGTVTFGPDSEIAKFIQWQGSQPNPYGPGTIADIWAIQGISNPYSNPAIVSTAVSVIDRTGNSEEPWNDKNWPAYQGSTKDAFNSAVNARTNPAEFAKLQAETGWDAATANSWIKRILEPDEWAAERAEEDRRNGVVVGGGFVTGPTAVPTTSSNNPSNPTVQTTGTSSTAVNYTALYSQTTSAAAAAAAGNAQKALDAFLRQNPSNAIRRRTGQAQLTPAQNTANTNNLDRLVAAAVATALAETAAVVSTTPAGTVAQINSDTSGNSITQTTTVEYTATAGNVSPAIDATIGAQNEIVQGLLGEVPPITQNTVSTDVAAIPGTIPTTPVTTTQADGSDSDPLTTIAVIGAAATGAAALVTLNRTNSNTTADITSGTPVQGDQYVSIFDPETQSWGVWDNTTGIFVRTGLSESESEESAANLNATVNQGVDDTSSNDFESSSQEVLKDLATQQAVLQAQSSFVNNGDWRVKLSLAPGSEVLYNDTTNRGILLPLFNTGGVIFPYTPQIDINYRADYESYIPTHSNYKSHMYKSSYVDTVTLTATFTAQDTSEADYLLAVIHFFRSVTKMFYGQSDANRGIPPPMVFLTGLGEFQFNGHPCVVTNFTYSLPKDVDYIRARSVNVNGTDLLTRRDRQTTPSNVISSTVTRLQNLFTSQGITKGAEFGWRPTPPTLGGKSPTYVPTKMDITLNLLPIQTRSQVSQLFNLEQYAAGNLLKGGFW